MPTNITPNPNANNPLPQIEPHPAQQQILNSRARYKVVACGRRFGKTEVGKLEIIGRALAGDVCWWLAPTYGTAAEVWRELVRLMTAVPGAAVTQAEHRIDLPGGGVIAVRSAHHPDVLRGAGLDFVVLDEAAFMEERAWAEVIRPMLLVNQGGALFLSTPNGRNWFWRVYQHGLDAEQPEWAAFHFTSADNPHVSAAELDAIRRQTPERVFNTEYLAQFTDDAGQVFRGVEQAATAPRHAKPIIGTRYVMGVDWGRDNDYTALVVIDAERRVMTALDRFREVGWGLQRGRLTALYEQWRPAHILAEANSIGTVNIEALQAAGLPVRPFITSASSKPPLIDGLALAIERGELALLPDETLLAELAAYTVTRRDGGHYRYSAPPGGHDDTVIALALAWRAASQPTVSLSFV